MINLNDSAFDAKAGVAIFNEGKAGVVENVLLTVNKKKPEDKQGSPEYVKLQDDYIKQHVQAHQQRGIPLQEAQTRAAAEFSEEIRALSVPYDPTAAGTFAGARKSQGIPLPDSWREYDIVKLIKSYDRRSAIDFSTSICSINSGRFTSA